MLAVDKHESDDELLDDDWPDDFFDDGYVKDNDGPDSEQQTIESTTTSKDALPSLAKNIYDLRIASGESEYNTVGNGKLEVSVVVADSGIDECIVNFCGLVRFRHWLSAPRFARLRRPHSEPLNVCYPAETVPVGEEKFAELRKLYGKVHLTELKLENVPIHKPAFQPLAELIADCTFDRLHLVVSATNYWRGTDELMRRARKDVVVSASMEACGMLATERPVTFISNWNEQQYVSYEADEQFMHLVLKGDNFIGFNIQIRSVDTMSVLVEMISVSTVPRKLDIRGLDYGITERYLKSVNANKVLTPPEAANDIPSSRGMKIQAFRHLKATLLLIQRPAGVNEGRLIVTSESYKEE